MAKTIDVADVIDRGKLSALQWGVFVLCGLVQLVDGFDGQAMAYAAPSLVRNWGLGHEVLGPVFSAALGGVFLGTLFISPLSDRFGRRPVLIAAVLCVAAATIATAFCSSVEELFVCRLFTGLGLGASLPTTFVLANEYAPRHRKTSLVLIMACGYAVGAAIGGLITAEMLSYYSWRSIFILGGILPLALALALGVFLPESARLLATRRDRSERVLKIMRKLDGGSAIPNDAMFTASIDISRGSFSALFADGRAWVTPLLWCLLFCNFTALNFLNSWLPSVMNVAGLSVKESVRVTTMFQIGGLIGILILGVIADRIGVRKVLAAILVGSAMATALIGSMAHTALALAPIVGIAGLCVIGAQNVLFALSAATYPTPIRSTGAGWAMGVGRLGSILGPYIGGGLLAAHLPVDQLFLIAAIPACLELVFLGAMTIVVARRKAPLEASSTSVQSA